MAKIIPIYPAQPIDLSAEAATDQTLLLKALVQEIKRHLASYLTETKAPAKNQLLDLSSLPFLPQTIAHLDAQLEQGEVNATVCDDAGSVEIWESRYHGVWRLRFRDSKGTTFLEQIEIGQIPLLLVSNPADIAQAIEKLDDFIFNNGEGNV